MTNASSSEALFNTYPAEKFQALAIDVWDGSPEYVNIFAANAQISYPILMNGSQGGILTNYNSSYDYMFIVGGDGIIKWRGDWDEMTVKAALDAAIAELSPSAVGDLPTSGHRLLANYPNPFNPLTRIPYELAAGSDPVAVRLEILDVRGRLVKTLVASDQAAGQQLEAVWDGTDAQGRRLPSGTYVARLRVDGVPQSRFMTLVK